jgi:glycosyltransferase involved in cell wall biosynthesis
MTGARPCPRFCRRLALLGLVASVAYNAYAWWRDVRRIAAGPPPASAPPPQAWSRLPSVSVLVAAWEEAELIDAHLASFLALRYPRAQLVLCAGGRDGTYARARRWAGPRVIVLEQAAGDGKQGALRRCLPHATGEVIVLTDADCLLSDQALLRLIAPVATGQAPAATGGSEPLLAQRRNRLVQYLWFGELAWARRQPAMAGSLFGRNCALLRAALDDIGGFDAPVATGTDYHLGRLLLRAGHAIRAVPSSRVATRYPARPCTYVATWRRWLKNSLIHGPGLGDWRAAGVVAGRALAYGAMLALALLAVLAPGRRRGALGPPLVVFGLAVLTRLRQVAVGARLAGRPLPWRLVAHIPAYACLDIAAVLLAVHDVIRPSRRARW